MGQELGLTLTGNLTLQDLFDYYERDYLALQKRERTVNSHRIDKVVGVMGTQKLITSLSIEQFLERYKDASPAHRNRYRALLKAVLRWGQERGYLSGEEVKLRALKAETEHNERTRRLDKESEENKIVERLSPDLRDLFYAALDTGLRFSALTKLQFSDVEKDSLVVRGTTQKNKRALRIPMTKRLQEIVSRRRTFYANAFAFNRPIDEKIFCIKGWQSQWRKVRSELGIKNLHWHDLRGEFASRLSEAGIEPSTIQQLLDHKNLQTTQRYLRPRVTRNREAIDALGV